MMIKNLQLMTASVCAGITLHKRDSDQGVRPQVQLTSLLKSCKLKAVASFTESVHLAMCPKYHQFILAMLASRFDLEPTHLSFL